MKIELKNFFKYYNGDLSHHKESVDKLAEEIAKVAPELLDDDSEWVAIFRNQKVNTDKDQDVVLPVLYYPQTDNYTQPERTCNSSACAMALESNYKEYNKIQPTIKTQILEARVLEL